MTHLSHKHRAMTCHTLIKRHAATAQDTIFSEIVTEGMLNLSCFSKALRRSKSYRVGTVPLFKALHRLKSFRVGTSTGKSKHTVDKFHI